MSSSLFSSAEWAAEARTLVLSTGAIIDGVVGAPVSGTPIERVSPRDGSALPAVAAAAPADVDRAVTGARAAFRSGVWSALAPRQRGQALIRFAELVERDARRLALTISVEMGKPAQDAHDVELRAIATTLRWYGELADKLDDASPQVGPDALALVTREPAGVVAAITPWNFPLTMTGWKIGPALVAGNSVVLKPAEATSSVVLALGELALEAGIPAGVLQVLPGAGQVIGQALGRHPDVNVLAFTGSGRVGRLLQGYAAESNGKRVWPELGGHSASVVLADADAEQAGATIGWAAFYNQGEMCSAARRLIVHRDVADAVIAAAVRTAGEMVPADPLDPTSRSGALISLAARDQIARVVDEAVAAGATVLAGGRIVEPVPGGAYYEPTILSGVAPGTTLHATEVFGPVLTVTVVDSNEEAIALANDSDYGLAASLWTRDLAAAHRFSRALDAGTVWVNCYEEGTLSMPFGGRRDSGFGADKSGHAVDKYTDLKSVWIAL